MITLFFFVILIFVCIFFKIYRYKKVPKNSRFNNFSKNNLDKWMNLTKKERYILSRKDSAYYLDKRKVLLDQIRKEYKIISKGNKNNFQ